MATINFLYRSKKEDANLNLRLLFRHEGKDHVIGSKTQLRVSKKHWTKDHDKKRPNDINIANEQLRINTELNKIENFILERFNKTNPVIINKTWLESTLTDYYNPPNPTNDLPHGLVAYFKAYVAMQKDNIKPSSIKKYNTVKGLIIKYEEGIKKPIEIIDVNDNFQDSFNKFCKEEGYAQNTIARALRSIKTVCRHAKSKGIETSPELDNINIKYKEVKHIYLSFDELEQIKSIEPEKLNERLENARDWLIISCYTGQRVSDFMRFSKEHIREENGKHFIEFVQMKTGKKMIVPLHDEVLAILDKRNRNFPRPISDQKYNNYIKEVCMLAEINELVEGGKRLPMESDSKKLRKEMGKYPKYELVTSHIGRRSFATNFYGTIPTTLLMNATGHKKESTFLSYIGKGNKDLAIELSKYF